jgi:hypothetical protein
MRGIGKAAVILSTLVLAGCRIYEEQKNTVIQNVTAAFLSPFVAAQRTTPLTQGTFKAAATVGPQKRAEKPVKPVKVEIEKPQVVERRVVKPATPCQVRVVISTSAV